MATTMALMAIGAMGVLTKNSLHLSEWKRLPAQVVVGSSLVEFTISVKQSNIEALYDKALAVSTPGNPLYGQYLTPNAIARLTAASSRDMRTVVTWLDEHGIDYARDKHILHVRTTAEAASKLLHTEFGMYRRSSDSRMVMRASDYELPASVALAVSAIFGLHGTPLPLPEPLTASSSAPAKVTPAVLAQTYHVDAPYVDRAGKGTQAVAEFQGQLMSKKDLTDFFKAEVPTMQSGDDQVERFVGAPYHEGHGVEALLDIEFIMGVAPGVRTEFWEWPERDFCGDLHNYTQRLLELQPGGPLVNSISYGWQGDLERVGCHPADQQAVDLNWAKLAAAGITVLISSGDSGSGCGRTNECASSNLKIGTQLHGDVARTRQALDASTCCDYARQYDPPAAGFTWTPPLPGLRVDAMGGAALDGGDDEDETAQDRAPTPPFAVHEQRAAAGAVGPSPPPVTPYPFHQAKYHVTHSEDRADFPLTDIHVLTGTLPPAGGDIRLHSANGTFTDTMIRFGPAQNHTKYLTHMRNMTMTMSTNMSTRLVGGKTFHGRAVFIDSPFAHVHELQQMLWYAPPAGTASSAPRSGDHPSPPSIVGMLVIGPNPGPPPPKGNCTLFRTVVSSSPSTDPKAASGGPAVTPFPFRLYPSWPASSPWVTAVGATRFVNQTIGQPERATDQFGSGGGFSSLWNQSRAPWQASAVAKYVARGAALEGFPPAGSFPPLGRATPDLAALGEGYRVYVSGKVEVVGGTSASTPAFAGYVSLLNQARSKAGKPPMGFFNPFAYQNPDAFTDVTRGTNAISRTGSKLEYGYAAAPGWDAATGLGSPRFDKLLAAALAV